MALLVTEWLRSVECANRQALGGKKGPWSDQEEMDGQGRNGPRPIGRGLPRLLSFPGLPPLLPSLERGGLARRNERDSFGVLSPPSSRPIPSLDRHRLAQPLLLPPLLPRSSGFPDLPPLETASLSRRRSFTRLPAPLSSTSFESSLSLSSPFASTSSSTRLPPLPPLAGRPSRPSRSATGRVRCICGQTTMEGKMLICGSCQCPSHVACMTSPGVSQLLNPFVCSSCLRDETRGAGSGSLEDRDMDSIDFTSIRRGRTSTSTSSGSFNESISSNETGGLASPTFSSCGSTDEGHLPSARGPSLTSSGGLSSSRRAFGRPVVPSNFASTGSSNSEQLASLEPNRKTFTCREHFIIWARDLFQAISPMATDELKNSSSTCTISCRNRRKKTCNWLLRAAADFDAVVPGSEDMVPFRLVEGSCHFEHGLACSQSTFERHLGPSNAPSVYSAAPKPQRRKAAPTLPGLPSSYDDYGSTTNPYALPPLSSGPLRLAHGSAGTHVAPLSPLDQQGVSSMERLRLDAAQGLEMLASSQYTNAAPRLRRTSSLGSFGGGRRYQGWSNDAFLS